jgi:tRNA (guanine37-N1)-methyltransferase
MVMKPEPWGEVIDAALEVSDQIIDLVILTPAGKKFTQRMAEKFASSQEIVFACGRYEGIDARVGDYYRSIDRVRVHEISIGDYVLNGGEVAALVMIEAITRLIPGVIGNPESLAEESHNEIGEVEYPSYTKPAQWRGLSVPEVLMSGNHGHIAQWRREEAQRRSQSQQ